MSQQAGHKRLYIFGKVWLSNQIHIHLLNFFNEPILFQAAVSKTFSRLKTGWVLSVAEASITSSGKIWITDFTEWGEKGSKADVIISVPSLKPPSYYCKDLTSLFNLAVYSTVPDQNSGTTGCIGLFPLEMNTFNMVLDFITITDSSV